MPRLVRGLGVGQRPVPGAELRRGRPVDRRRVRDRLPEPPQADGTFIRAFGSVDFAGNQPIGIAFDPASGGLLFVSDTGGNIDEFDASGGFLRTFTNSQLTYPEGVAIDPVSGDVYVGDGADRAVLEFTPTGSFVTSFVAQASSADPAGVAFSPATGDMYFSDLSGDQVEAFAPPPTCQAASDSVGHDATMQIALSCTDPSFQPQTIAVASEPAHGTLGAIDQTGPTSATVTYTPTVGYAGADALAFGASGVGASAPATVSLTVAPGATPVCQAGSQSVAFGSAAALTLACSAGGDPVTYAIVGGPSHGMLSALNAGTGTVTYTPVAGYSGPDHVTFQATDPSGTSSTATYSLTVAAPSGAAAAPALSALHVSPGAFSTAGRRVGGRCVAQTRANGSRPRCTRQVVLVVSYTDSEPGTVTFTLERVLAGRKMHGGCVAPTQANRTRPACTRRVRTPGTVIRQAAAGANTFDVTGRLDGVTLTPGGYELIATPKSSGRTGHPDTVRFTVA